METEELRKKCLVLEEEVTRGWKRCLVSGVWCLVYDVWRLVLEEEVGVGRGWEKCLVSGV